ncbi:Di-N-acetylchitobiase-like [Oopsacas minuta]|uniref:Di-N-acetylchitobiase-like n=1 Tax=Oopsacas minuta TaxID=111878 RepID=A0AAV7JUQ6_9METZ|nr:Di-N-acetylchitobiase-like [Oopsacas minuta]
MTNLNILTILSLLFISYSYTSVEIENNVRKCPCKYSDSCDIIPLQKDKKIIIGFMTDLGYSFFRFYEMYKLTTVFLPLNDTEFLQDFLCYAHEQKVSVLLRVDPTLKVVLNNSLHRQWAQETIKTVQDRYLDGINFDFQSPLDFDHASYYTSLVNYTCTNLRVANKEYQCSLNMPWSGDCIDGRCYNVYSIAEVVDYIVILSFDVQDDEDGPPCYARANSPFYQGLGAVVVYVEAGLALKQVVVALPWYGYMYDCLSVDKSNLCTIKERTSEPYCSDRVGKKMTYNDFVSLINNPKANVTSHWNSTYMSPYLMIYNGDSIQQGWYDNPMSLSFKINAVKQMELGGIGVYNMDCLSYIDDMQVREMWNTLDLIN